MNTLLRRRNKVLDTILPIDSTTVYWFLRGLCFLARIQKPFLYIGRGRIHLMSSDKTRQQIAGRIRAARLESGLTQNQVAEKAGINVTVYAKIERGDAKPTIESLRKISQALKIKSSKILPF